MNTPADKLAWIIARLAEGRTVQVSTALRSLAIKPKTWDAWAKAGKPLVRVHGASLQVFERGSYVCADYCRISAS